MFDADGCGVEGQGGVFKADKVGTCMFYVKFTRGAEGIEERTFDM